MHNSKLLHSKKRLGLLTSCFVLVVISLLIIFSSIKSDTADSSLKLMKLNQTTEPTFMLSSQLPYTSHLVSDLNMSQALTAPKPLNISMTLTSANYDPNSLIHDLARLSTTQDIFLSLIPDINSLSNEAYINLCQAFYTACHTQNSSHIKLICYPMNDANYKSYKQLPIDYIGVTIESLEDLQYLTKLYDYFGDSVTYCVQDYLALSYKAQEKEGSKAVYRLYYDLAVNHPYVSTIFCPYLSLPVSNYSMDSSDLFVNAHNLTVYSSYYSGAYKHILDQIWTTTKAIPVSNQSPFEPLDEYSVLKGTEQLIISPNSSLLEEIDTNGVLKLVYRINNTDITIDSYAPYLTTIDTNRFANGINRFKLLGYDIASNVVLSPVIDFTIENDNLKPRAPRQATHYSKEQKPIYTSSYIPILMYHTIADSVEPENQNSCVTTANFDAQMKSLVDHGYTSITFLDLYNYLNGQAGLPEKPILITMDDGYLNNYTHAFPIYKKYGISATLFVSPFYMENQNTPRHFGWQAAQEMENSGLIDIESHGYDHTPFPQLSTQGLKYHISHSRGLIEQHLGKRDVFTVACPQFRNNYLTRKTLAMQGVDFQITKLAKKGTKLKPSSLKRINVPNTMTPDELINTISTLTNP